MHAWCEQSSEESQSDALNCKNSYADHVVTWKRPWQCPSCLLQLTNQRRWIRQLHRWRTLSDTKSGIKPSAHLGKQNVLKLWSHLNAISVSQRSVAIVMGLWSPVWSTIIATEAVFQDVIAKCAVSSNNHLGLRSKENWKQTYWETFVWSAVDLITVYTTEELLQHEFQQLSEATGTEGINWSIDRRCYLEAAR